MRERVDPGSDWRTFAPNELAREYSPSSKVPGGWAPWLARWREATIAARRLPGAQLDVRYGSAVDAALDLYLPTDVPASGAPLVAYFHGGYWQDPVSRADSAYGAPGLVAAGIAHAVPDYALAPAVTVREIGDQAARAVRWLLDRAPELGVDPTRIVLAGHSAGAQLAFMAARGLPPGTIAGLVLLGGVFDLVPIVHTPVNDALGLDEDEARALSPAHLVRAGLPPALVILGTGETDEFRRQSREFAVRYAAAGNEVLRIEVEGRHHFDLPLDLGDSTTELGMRTIRLVREGRL